jgi:hypothetical protein
LVPKGDHSTDPEDYVHEFVERERKQIQSSAEAALDQMLNLPDYNDRRKAVRKQLARMAPLDEAPVETTELPNQKALQ